MIGITNVGGSGGGGNAFAYIGVKYPAGSTVTCSDGTKTFRAKDTSGAYVFSVPYAATWTVTAVRDWETASKNVTITSEWQVESITIRMWDGELYDAGNQYTAITGGWSYKSAYKTTNVGYAGINSSNFVSFNSSNISFAKQSTASYCCYIRTANKIDLSEAVSITLTTASGSYYDNDMSVSIFGGESSGSLSTESIQYETLTKATGEHTITLNSSAKGTYYILVGSVNGNANKNVTISKIKVNFAS